MRNSFVFYKSWVDALNELPDEYLIEGYKAVTYYGVNGKLPKQISAVVKSLLTTISFEMDRCFKRYNASVENGKKGGRPRKNAPKIADKNEKINDKKNISISPKIKHLLGKNYVVKKNLENLEKPNHNLYVYVYDYVYVNNISKLNNNKFIYLGVCAGARVRERKDLERKPLLNYFSTFFDLYRGKFYDAGLEIVDCMLEALDVGYFDKRGLLYKGKRYSFDDLLSVIAKVTDEEFGKIVNQLVFNETIKSRAWYTLGCVFKASSVPTTKEANEQERFKSDMLNNYQKQKN